MRKINIPIFVPHAGCTHACIFCNQRHITGQQQPMTAETAKATIEQSLHTIPADTDVEIAYFGGSFTAIEPGLQIALLQTAYSYIQSGRVRGIRVSTRPDCIDRAVINRLKTYGVTTVELGAQSTDDEVLSLCMRGHTRADIFKGAAMVSEAGIDLGLQMMLGLPGDTPARAMRTAREFISLKPVCTRIYPTLVIADSPLCGMYRAGQYKPMELEDAVALCAEIYRMFLQNNIEVIRMGLMASESLQSGGNIVAGPFHPAFGELVQSRLYLQKMMALLQGYGGTSALLYVHPRELSKALGNRRRNIEAVRETLHIHLEIKAKEEVEVGHVIW